MKKIIAAITAAFAFAFAGSANAFSFDDATMMAKNAATATVNVVAPLAKNAAISARNKTCAAGQTAEQEAVIANVKGAILDGISTITPDFAGGDKVKREAMIANTKGMVFDNAGAVLKLAC